MSEQSLNALAEQKKLAPFSSWETGPPRGWFPMPATEDAAIFFKENGFLVMEGAVDSVGVEEMRREAAEICKGHRGSVPGLEPTTDSESDDEVLRKVLCIHFPHKISEVMFAHLANPSVVQVLQQIIGPNVKCMQSMLFIKSAGKPGQAWHQDEIYIPTRDRSLTGAWIALDDATVENGCLWVIPGSQKPGILYRQEWHGDSRFDCAHEAKGFPYSSDQAIPVEVKAGSIVFFNGYLLHRSLPNYASGGYRRSLVNHYMSAESFLPWGSFSEENAYIATADNRDVIMVSGTDPYAHLGYEDKAGAHVRYTGEGGCGNYQYNEQAKKAD